MLAVAVLRQEQIPLNKLALSEANVRKQFEEREVAELAASIGSVGLLHNLVVVQTRSKAEVIGGGLRFRALQKLLAEKRLKNDAPIPCSVISEEHAGDLNEISLAENVRRYAMDPVEEALAFKTEAESRHRTVGEIAARFGAEERFVRQRLKLADINPKLLDLYRKKKLNLECLQAFTVSDSHPAQWDAWRNLGEYYKDRPGTETARMIRNALKGRAIGANDPRVQFVGVEAYRKAGGRVAEDLFSQHDAERMQVLDEDLLNKLVEAKLGREAERVRKEGWTNVVAVPQWNWALTHGFEQAKGEQHLPPKLKKKQEKLEAEHRRITDTGDGEFDDEQAEQLSAIEQELEEIEDQAEYRYPDEVKRAATVYVTLDRNGKAKVSDAYLPRPETATPPASQTAQAETPAKPKSPYSKSLVESLTMHKTAAIAAELMRQPDIALSSVVYGMLISDMDSYSYRLKSGVEVRSINLHYRLDGSKALTAIEAEWAGWQSKLPKKAEELWGWVASRDENEKLALLAVLAARALNGVVAGNDAYESSRRARNVDEIARTLQIGMRDGEILPKWFEPTAENFFDRVPKAIAFQALDAVGKNGVEPSIKKDQLAKLAEGRIAGTGWIPEPMRIKSHDEAADDFEYDDAEAQDAAE